MLLKLYLTYFKQNPTSGKVYVGRTSGWGIVRIILARRDRKHHKNKEGFLPAEIDKVSTDSDAIRGREQQLIDNNVSKGISGNIINGISPRNKKRNKYLAAALKLFGAVSLVVLIIFIFKTRF